MYKISVPNPTTVGKQTNLYCKKTSSVYFDNKSMIIPEDTSFFSNNDKQY